MSEIRHSDDIATACALADAAGAAIRPHFRTALSVDNKLDAGFDPVTAADRASEEAMRAVLAARAPADGILGEEFGEQAGTTGRRWVLDPIDGTRAFISGVPSWTVLIGLETGGVPEIGVIDQPHIGERFIGWPGGSRLEWRGTTLSRSLWFSWVFRWSLRCCYLAAFRPLPSRV